jgi:hypothetical protein
MNGDKKEGMTVKEIENFAKKNRVAVVFCLSFILALFFSFVFFGPGWAMVCATIGGVLGLIFSDKVEQMSKKIFQFVFKQEQMTQLILGVVALIISIFLPPLVFLIIGFHGGRDISEIANSVRPRNGS